MPTFDYGDQSEYGGNGVMPNTLFPQVQGVPLSPSDQLRLQSLTGQEVDTHAPLDPYFWQGGIPPEPIKPAKVVPPMNQDARYKETPRK